MQLQIIIILINTILCSQHYRARGQPTFIMIYQQNMFQQPEQYEQASQRQGELHVDLDLRQNEEPEPQWLDPPLPKYQRSKKAIKASPKISPKIQKQKDPVILFLMNQLDNSKGYLKKNLNETIKQQIEGLQNKVYLSQTTNSKKQYLNGLYQHTSPNKYVKQEIFDTLKGSETTVQKQIKGRGAPAIEHRRIPKNKDEVRQLEKADQYRLIKLKQGQIKHKVGSLRYDLDQQYVRSRLKARVEEMDGVVDSQYYSIDNPRTKEAGNFIKDIQRRRKQQQQQYHMYLSTLKQRQQYQKQKEAQMKEIERMERRTKLKEYYQSKLQQRLEQKQLEQQKKQEFQDWVKAYQREKPLELQKQEQYRMKVLIPQMEQRHKKIMTIKAEHKPIDLQQIAEHEMKYLEYKKDDTIRKKAEIQMGEEENQMRQQDMADRFYKGKYRLMVLQQMLDQKYPLSNKEVQQSKKERIKAYDHIIRQELKPIGNKVESSNALEGQTVANQKFVRRVRNMNGSLTVSNRGQVQSAKIPQKPQQRTNRRNSQDLDAYKQGIKNLAFMKSLVRQNLAKQQQSPPLIKLVQEKEVEKPKGFLQLQREKKSNKRKEHAIAKQIQSTDVTANEQIHAIVAKHQILDERLKRQQLKLKNNKEDKHEHAAKVENDYVNAIKAKLSILNKFD